MREELRVMHGQQGRLGCLVARWAWMNSGTRTPAKLGAEALRDG